MPCKGARMGRHAACMSRHGHDEWHWGGTAAAARRSPCSWVAYKFSIAAAFLLLQPFLTANQGEKRSAVSARGGAKWACCATSSHGAPTAPLPLQRVSGLIPLLAPEAGPRGWQPAATGASPEGCVCVSSTPGMTEYCDVGEMTHLKRCTLDMEARRHGLQCRAHSVVACVSHPVHTAVP